MVRQHMAAEQIPAQPAAIILESSLGGQFRDRMTESQILGLDQSRRRVDQADFTHGGPDRVDLVEERQPAGILIAPVRVPVTIEAGEACRRQGFVDGCPVLDPRIALGNGARMGGEPRCEVIGQQACIGWAATMMNKADDRTDSEALEFGQLLVAPGEISLLGTVGRYALPQYGIAERLQLEFRKKHNIGEAIMMPGADRLIKVVIADPVQSVFTPTP